MDKMDVPMAKPLLMALDASKTAADHKFPLPHLCMQLVPEEDVYSTPKVQEILTNYGHAKNTWTTSKLVYIKTWEIELLDYYRRCSRFFA